MRVYHLLTIKLHYPSLIDSSHSMVSTVIYPVGSTVGYINSIGLSTNTTIYDIYSVAGRNLYFGGGGSSSIYIPVNSIVIQNFIIIYNGTSLSLLSSINSFAL